MSLAIGVMVSTYFIVNWMDRDNPEVKKSN